MTICQSVVGTQDQRRRLKMKIKMKMNMLLTKSSLSGCSVLMEEECVESSLYAYSKTLCQRLRQRRLSAQETTSYSLKIVNERTGNRQTSEKL